MTTRVRNRNAAPTDRQTAAIDKMFAAAEAKVGADVDIVTRSTGHVQPFAGWVRNFRGWYTHHADQGTLTRAMASQVITRLGEVLDEHAGTAATPPADGPEPSALGEAILDLPARAGRYAGRYAVEVDGDRRFYMIDRPQSGKWAGWAFVRTGATRQRVATVNPDGGVRFADRTAETVAAHTLALNEVAKDAKAAAIAYGRWTNTCSQCGATLDDPESVAAGIGPVCASRLGW